MYCRLVAHGCSAWYSFVGRLCQACRLGSWCEGLHHDTVTDQSFQSKFCVMLVTCTSHSLQSSTVFGIFLALVVLHCSWHTLQAAQPWRGLKWQPSIPLGSTTPLSKTLPGQTSTTLLRLPTGRCFTVLAWISVCAHCELQTSMHTSLICGSHLLLE